MLETDKATLDVPAPHNGTIKALKIAVGDRVSVGSVILTLEEEATEPSTSAQAPHASTVEPIAATPATVHLAAPPPPESAEDNALGYAPHSPHPALRLVSGAAAPIDPRRVPHASSSIRRIAWF